MRPIVTATFLLLASVCSAQTKLPAYPLVVKEFFKNHRYASSENQYALAFAKMKDGWHAQVIDRFTEDPIVDEVFWSSKNHKYMVLEEFDRAVTTDEVEESTHEHITGAGFNYYGFERCAYYGYNGWAADMIRDFGKGNLQTYSDTLLEGLARAYSAYASFFSWYQFGGRDKTGDPLKKKLLPLEKPTRQRVDSLDHYFTKAISVFNLLFEKYPAYETIIGNSGMKVFNEQMHAFTQMELAGYPDLAAKYFQQIKPNKTLTSLARIYLESAPPNSILITYGDNDSFPLWYVQKSENYRNDVSVINSSLLGMPVHIDKLAGSGVKFSSTRSLYGDSTFTYVPRIGTGEGRITLGEFLENIQQRRHTLDYNQYGVFAAYKEETVTVPVDLKRFSEISDENFLAAEMEIKPTSYLLAEEFMVLDLIHSNLYTRPMLFTSASDLLKPYLVRTGAFYQLLPADSGKVAAVKAYSVKRIREYLAGFKTIPATDVSSGISVTPLIDNLAFDLHQRVVKFYLDQSKQDSAKTYADNFVKLYQGKPPHYWYNWEFYIAMIDAGSKKEGVRHLEMLVEELVRDIEKPSGLKNYMKPSTGVDMIKFIQYELEKRDLKSDKIDASLVRLEK